MFIRDSPPYPPCICPGTAKEFSLKADAVIPEQTLTYKKRQKSNGLETEMPLRFQGRQIALSHYQKNHSSGFNSCDGANS